MLADDALARAGLVALCTMAGLAVVLARAGSSTHGALLAQGDPRPAALVYDVGPSAGAGLDFSSLAPVPVVALVSGEGEAKGAFAAGARAVLARTVDDPQALASAVTAAAYGYYVSAYPMSAPASVPKKRAGEGAPSEELTGRELEVLRGLTEGLSNKRIAAQLFISEHTVKTHVNAILAKLGAESRTDAVVRAARLGLVLL